jgi:hypothetical protein
LREKLEEPGAEEVVLPQALVVRCVDDGLSWSMLWKMLLNNNTGSE